METKNNSALPVGSEVVPVPAPIPDPFTVINTIVGILLYPLSLPFMFTPQLPAIPPQQMPMQQIPMMPRQPSFTAASASNKETWEWVDHRGKKKVITVHRDVIFNNVI